MGSYNRLSNMESEDKAAFAHIEEKVAQHGMMSRIRKDWRYYLPLILSAIAVITAIVMVIIMALKINNLENVVASLQDPGRTAALVSGKDVTQRLTRLEQKLRSGKSVKTDDVRVAEIQKELEEMRNMTYEILHPVSGLIGLDSPLMLEVKSMLADSMSTSYIRWGKQSCPGNASLVYTGFVAGGAQHSSRLSGGGANYLCLPFDPEWNKFDMKNDSLGFSWIYAAEYITFDVGIFDDEIHGHNTPCSVCNVPRTSNAMIPVKRSCPNGWTHEYDGYLMSSMVNRHRSEYICVDESPDFLQGTRNVSGGGQLYFTSAYCQGSGAFGEEFCPPFIHARELTCVVCTK